MQKGCSLSHDGVTAGFWIDEPFFCSNGAAVTDEDGALVVLIKVVDGALDDVSSETDVGWIKDKSF